MFYVFAVCLFFGLCVSRDREIDTDRRIQMEGAMAGLCWCLSLLFVCAFVLVSVFVSMSVSMSLSMPVSVSLSVSVSVSVSASVSMSMSMSMSVSASASLPPPRLSSPCLFVSTSHYIIHYPERWGAGVETQKNVRGEIGGWGRVPFNEPYAPSLSTIYDGA